MTNTTGQRVTGTTTTTLDTVVNQAAINQSALDQATQTSSVLSAGQEELLPIDDYVKQFSVRYKKEEKFRDIVHQYLGLGKMQRAGLQLGKAFRPGWYAQKTNRLIQDYAIKIHEELQTALQVQQELAELQQLQNQVEGKKAEVVEVVQQQEKKAAEYQQTVQVEQEAVQRVVQAVDTKIEEERMRKQELLREIGMKPAAAELVKRKLADKLQASGYLKSNSDGQFVFDEGRIADRLGEMFLDEIVQEIEDSSGKGFMNKITAAYGGLIAYWDEMEDLLELPSVDWVQTMVHSRMKGSRMPRFPYYIVGKADEQVERVKYISQVESAMIIDKSGSMQENQRWEMGKKAILGTRALMSRLDKKNETSLAWYNEYVCEVTAQELLKDNSPNNGTRTDLALEWLLKKLKDKGPTIAYLATDGMPNSVVDTMYVAQKFREYPQIRLRIFLIDGNAEAEDNIRKIGKAAGADTRVSAVKNYQLGQGIVKDVADAIGEMYSIDKF